MAGRSVICVVAAVACFRAIAISENLTVNFDNAVVTCGFGCQIACVAPIDQALTPVASPTHHILLLPLSAVIGNDGLLESQSVDTALSVLQDVNSSLILRIYLATAKREDQLAAIPPKIRESIQGHHDGVSYDVDWNSPYLVNIIMNTIQQVAQRYKSHSRFAFMEVGFLGAYGSFRVAAGSLRSNAPILWSNDTLTRILQAHYTAWGANRTIIPSSLLPVWQQVTGELPAAVRFSSQEWKQLTGHYDPNQQNSHNNDIISEKYDVTNRLPYRILVDITQLPYEAATRGLQAYPPDFVLTSTPQKHKLVCSNAAIAVTDISLRVSNDAVVQFVFATDSTVEQASVHVRFTAQSAALALHCNTTNQSVTSLPQDQPHFLYECSHDGQPLGFSFEHLAGLEVVLRIDGVTITLNPTANANNNVAVNTGSAPWPFGSVPTSYRLLADEWLAKMQGTLHKHRAVAVIAIIVGFAALTLSCLGRQQPAKPLKLQNIPAGVPPPVPDLSKGVPVFHAAGSARTSFTSGSSTPSTPKTPQRTMLVTSDVASVKKGTHFKRKQAL